MGKKILGVLPDCWQRPCNGMAALLEWAEQSPWIPVSERLPEGVTGCLINYNGGVVKHVNYLSIDKSFRTGGGQEICNVTHWMPIPEMPDE